MTEYKVSFEAISHRSLEDLSGDFYEKFDGLLVERAGRIVVSVYVDATSGTHAAFQLIGGLEAIELCLVRVDQDLVDASEIAARLGVSRQAVSLWAKGTRGDSFPHPIGTPGGKRIWAWGQITHWAWQKGKLREAPALTMDDAAFVDAFLADRRVRAGSQTAVPFTWALRPSSSKGHKGDRHVWVDAGAYAERSFHSPSQMVDR